MASFPQALAKIIINEVEPRSRKYGRRPPVEFTAALAVLESEGEIRRHDTRRLLDEYFAKN